jgi:hypothetical protein
MDKDDLMVMADIDEEDVLRAVAWWNKTAKPEHRIDEGDADTL